MIKQKNVEPTQWIKMNDEIREGLQSEIDFLNRVERPRRMKDEMWTLNAEIKEMKDTINSKKAMFWKIEHILLKYGINFEFPK